jgi:rRNA maturation endonuclease Nob1
MNMIDYNKAVEALEKERQYLLNREQYGAENVLVKHAINVIHYLPIIRQPEVIRCKDCKHATMTADGKMCKYCEIDTDDFGYQRVVYHDANWFCADGERREET